MTIDHPTGRDLERSELRALVDRLARRPELWRALVAHDRGQRVYEELLRDEHLSLWLICWMDDQDTGFHDHDTSAGAVAVAEGHVREERLSLGGRPVARELGPGKSFDFAAHDIHRVLHGGGGPAVTLHAYSPPLWRMAPTWSSPTASCSATRSPTRRSCGRSRRPSARTS
jgi:hypothetical protein